MRRSDHDQVPVLVADRAVRERHFSKDVRCTVDTQLQYQLDSSNFRLRTAHPGANAWVGNWIQNVRVHTRGMYNNGTASLQPSNANF